MSRRESRLILQKFSDKKQNTRVNKKRKKAKKKNKRKKRAEEGE